MKEIRYLCDLCGSRVFSDICRSFQKLEPGDPMGKGTIEEAEHFREADIHICNSCCNVIAGKTTSSPSDAQE